MRRLSRCSASIDRSELPLGATDERQLVHYRFTLHGLSRPGIGTSVLRIRRSETCANLILDQFDSRWNAGLRRRTTTAEAR